MVNYSHHSDDELIAMFIVGDAMAMETLFHRYKKSVYSWLLRTTADVSESEDLYHEIWLKVISRSEKYKPGNFKAWLWQIVHNTTIDRLRKRSPLLVLDEPVDADDESGQTVLNQLSDDTAVNALMQIEEKERKEIICRAIEELPPVHREVVLLRINGELSFKEISELLTVPLGTVLARMHHAVNNLKEILLKKGVG